MKKTYLCPHCQNQLHSHQIPKMTTEWVFSQCSVCEGSFFIRKPEVQITKIEAYSARSQEVKLDLQKTPVLFFKKKNKILYWLGVTGLGALPLFVFSLVFFF